jgi:hypothetical protein
MKTVFHKSRIECRKVSREANKKDKEESVESKNRTGQEVGNNWALGA